MVENSSSTSHSTNIPPKLPLLPLSSTSLTACRAPSNSSASTALTDTCRSCIHRSILSPREIPRKSHWTMSLLLRRSTKRRFCPLRSSLCLHDLCSSTIRFGKRKMSRLSCADTDVSQDIPDLLMHTFGVGIYGRYSIVTHHGIASTFLQAFVSTASLYV